MADVDSEFIGEWRASWYDIAGRRSDIELTLRREGAYEAITRRFDGRVDRRSGTWDHERSGSEHLKFAPGFGRSEGDDAESCWILRLPGELYANANTFMILRRVAIASRNLPVLFQRVHVDDEWGRRHAAT